MPAVARNRVGGINPTGHPSFVSILAQERAFCSRSYPDAWFGNRDDDRRVFGDRFCSAESGSLQELRSDRSNLSMEQDGWRSSSNDRTVRSMARAASDLRASGSALGENH